MATIEHKEFIERLLAFLEVGFQDPIKIINYLQSRDTGNKLQCKTKACEDLITVFENEKGGNPWSLKALAVFNESRRQWYKIN